MRNVSELEKRTAEVDADAEENVVVVTPQEALPLRDKAEWVSSSHYASGTKILPGEIGRLGNTRFISQATEDEFITVSKADASKISQREGYLPASRYRNRVAGEFGRIGNRRYVLEGAEAENHTRDMQGDEDDVHPGDEKVFVSLADLKRFRRRTLNDLNKILGPQGFQRELIGMQTRLALMWNGINAVVYAFLQKRVIAPGPGWDDQSVNQLAAVRLLDPDDISKAGEALAAQAKENMEAAKKAIAEKRHLRPEERTEVPLEKFREILRPGQKKPEGDPGTDEASNHGAAAEEGKE